MTTKTKKPIKKHKNVFEKIDSYVPNPEIQDIEELKEYGFLVSPLGDALLQISLSDNPFQPYVLNIMIDIEDSSRSFIACMDEDYKPIKLENDTDDMNSIRASVFYHLDELVEDEILEVSEVIELVAPKYRDPK